MKTLEKVLKYGKYLAVTTAILGSITLIGYCTSNLSKTLNAQRQNIEENLDEAGKKQLSSCENYYELDRKVCNKLYTSEVMLNCYKKHYTNDGQCELDKQCLKKVDQAYHSCRYYALKSASLRLKGEDCITSLCSK